MEERGHMVQWMREQPLDCLVIGGGITGAGIALDAALRGFSVALLERSDFGSGTSGASSKLIHGGLRYLEQARLGLVLEGVRERSALLRNAPHRVRRLPFLVPVYEGAPRGRLALEAGLVLYDGMALLRAPGLHRPLGAASLRALEPSLVPAGLRGGALFWDCATDDARLTLEVVRAATEAGALAANHLRVRSLMVEKGRVTGVIARDELGGSTFPLDARVVVNATGPWVDEVRRALPSAPGPLLRPSRGSHVVLPRSRLALRHAVVMRSPRDGRVTFAIPWGEATLVGTTEVEHEGSADGVVPTGAEVDYLLEVVARHFPTSGVGRDDVLSAWSGLRPLLGAGAPGGLSAASREFVVEESREGLLTVAGGKLTGYRLMAERTVDRLASTLRWQFRRKARRGCTTRHAVLMSPDDVMVTKAPERYYDRLAHDLGLSPDTARHLLATYMRRHHPIATAVREDGSLARRLVEGLPYIEAEVKAWCGEEMCASLADALRRRTHIFQKAPDQGLEAAARVATLMAAELGWDADRREAELGAYRALVAASRAWRN
ncbi:MAG: glycerol-3-phosphate dehydrogenase/oxidase [Planctomycetes bacterium]|nr:glycerol-3-phosphate dehydrogenase/oxidase [Planctomycetota bacterium]